MSALSTSYREKNMHQPSWHKLLRAHATMREERKISGQTLDDDCSQELIARQELPN